VQDGAAKENVLVTLWERLAGTLGTFQ